MSQPIHSTLACRKTFCWISALVLIVLMGFSSTARPQSLTALWSFSKTDGTSPHAPIQGRDGNFYGTTSLGGILNAGNNGLGWGTVFRITPDGILTNLHSFILTDGGMPNALVQGNDGNFYGTTFVNSPGNRGTVFKITPAGTLTTLWVFGQNPSIDSGADQPIAGLVQGTDGNFYGTTTGGSVFGDGIVFRITPSGTLTNLHIFSGPDGANSQWGPLVQGADGNFYGVTANGGTNNLGAIYRISPTGNFTNLYSFTGLDGEFPDAGLVRGNDGNFYGTTSGGATNNSGTIFRMTPAGVLTNLYFFTGGADGGDPTVLIQGSDGNFYGTTAAGSGASFRITPTGGFTNLHFFSGTDGSDPINGFTQGSDGSFYGTTVSGGSSNAGTIFRLTVPLNPPANEISALQTTGNDVTISIPSVATETYQLQFSTSLNPTNWVNVPNASLTNSIGALITLTNSGGATSSQRFYRFDITP